MFVNEDKHKRAQLIVAGKESPEIGAETIAKWAAKIAEAKPKDPVQFVYEGLGGVVAGSPEHKEILRKQAKAKEAKKVK